MKSSTAAHALFGVFGLLSLTGCPNPPATAGAPAAPAPCERVGAQCKLPNGVLGVCENATPGQAALTCMPQH